MIFVLDTNIVSYMLKDDEETLSRYRRESDRGSLFVIPSVVYFEIQRWLEAHHLHKKRDRFEALCQHVKYMELDRTVWQKAAHLYATLRRQGKPIDDMDLIIASFCLIHGFTLITNNARHFERVDGLSLVNWKMSAEG